MQRLSLTIALFLFIIGIVIGVAFLVNPQDEQETTLPLNPLVPSFVYSITNEPTRSAEIRLFEISTNTQHRISRFSLPTGTVPTIGFQSRDKLLLDVEVPAEQFLITISNKSVEKIRKTDAGFPVLLSPKGSFLAFNRPREALGGMLGETELVIRPTDGEDRILESGSIIDIGTGMLTPLVWSADERTLYAYRTHATEGDIVGLYAIDISTMEQRRIEKIDELQISRYVFDQRGNVYGFQPHYIYRPEDKAQTAFFRVSLDSGEVTSMTLRNSSLADIFTADPTGRYLVYANGDDFNARNVWLYDFETETEIPITENAVVYQMLPWNDGQLVFLEQSETGPTTTNLVLYDIKTGTRKVLVNGGRHYFTLIGWYQ